MIITPFERRFEQCPAERTEGHITWARSIIAPIP